MRWWQPHFRPVAQYANGTGQTMRRLSWLVALSLGFGSYFVLRYLGLWVENDTAVFVRSITGLQDAGRLVYSRSYPHGYAYPVWASSLSDVLGVPVPELLQLYTPLLGTMFLATFAFSAYRRLLASDRLAMIAAAVLFLVPELVFSVSRGNHEKLTLSLTLLALLALVASFLEAAGRARWGVFAAWVAVYYMTAYTLVSLNALFGSSFIVATTVVLLITTLLLRMESFRDAVPSGAARRLALVVGTSWLLVALVMFYVYPQAGANLALLATTLERLSALLLTFSPSSDPYQVGGTDWSSTRVYTLLSSFRWVLFVSSLLAWLVISARVFRARAALTPNRLFLLALYGAFGLQVALAIPVDFLGLAAGSNLQVRMYAYFVLLAAPMMMTGLRAVRKRLTGHSRIWKALRVAGALGIVIFAGLSILKSTLDPTVSNRWLFYRPSEVRALYFWDNVQTGDSIWMGPEDRLFFAYMLNFSQGRSNGNRFITSRALPEEVSSAIQSKIVIENTVAWDEDAPRALAGQLVYDNGVSGVRRRVPLTPFQR